MSTLVHPLPPDLIPTYQDRALQTLTQAFAFQRSENLITPANLEKYAAALADEISKTDNQGRPFFRWIVGQAFPLQRISSEAWNRSQDRIYVDLYAIHKLLQESFSDDAVRSELTREKFVQTKGAILRIVNELRLFQFLRANPTFQDAKFVNFSSALNETEKRPAAVVDGAVRLLELAPRARQTQSRRNVGLSGTRVTVEHLGGGRQGGRNDEFSADKMLDANPESFWAEMIMAESPIVQDYAPSADAGLGTQFEVNGPVCHVYLEFAKTAVANTVRLLPFGDFPVRVIDIAFKEAPGQTQWVKLPNFTVEDPTLDWIEVNFEPKAISSMRVTLQQMNYRANTYHLPERLVRNGLVWQQIGRSRKSDVLTDLALTPEQQDIIQADPQELIRLQAEEDFKNLLDEQTIRAGRDFQVDVEQKTVKAAAGAATKHDPTAANEVLTLTEGTEVDPAQKTIDFKVYEYVYGIREFQLQYNLYQPFGHYSSQKFRSGASVLEMGITTEERHPIFNDGLGDFAKTSIEWDLEIGRDRKYPVAPKNWRVDGVITVPDEFLQFDRLTRQAVTRLPASSKAVTLRKNGTTVPLDAFTVEYYTPGSSSQLLFLPETGSTNPGYLTNTVAPAFRRNLLLVTFTDMTWYDPNAVYTIRYTAADDADVIDVDEDLDSVEMSDPEIFDKTSRDNQVVLRAYPFVDYRIINSDLWSKVDGEAKWLFAPTTQNYLTGTVTVTNGSTTVTGLNTLWAGLGSGPFVLKVVGDNGIYFVETILSNTGLRLATPYQGASGSTKAYILGTYHESDGKVYAFDRNTYEPVKVFVNDIRAKNLTDYEAFQHQAFTDIPRSGRQIQFIQAGNILYFNRPIEKSRIEVYYSWLTEYVKVNATLRCNIPVRTVLTPQVNSYRVELKTSKL